mgnify:CR=1 FL=1
MFSFSCFKLPGQSLHKNFNVYICNIKYFEIKYIALYIITDYAVGMATDHKYAGEESLEKLMVIFVDAE